MILHPNFSVRRQRKVPRLQPSETVRKVPEVPETGPHQTLRCLVRPLFARYDSRTHALRAARTSFRTVSSRT
jgi:hypothetical protein